MRDILFDHLNKTGPFLYDGAIESAILLVNSEQISSKMNLGMLHEKKGRDTLFLFLKK